MKKAFFTVLIATTLAIMCKQPEPAEIDAAKRLYQVKMDSINSSKDEVKHILSETYTTSNYKKLAILVKDTTYTSEKIESMISTVKNSNFLSKNCIIELWTNKEAQKICYKYTSDDIPNSKYIFVAEHLLATHYCFIPETIFNELMDNKYRQLGGNKRRLVKI